MNHLRSAESANPAPLAEAAANYAHTTTVIGRSRWNYYHRTTEAFLELLEVADEVASSDEAFSDLDPSLAAFEVARGALKRTNPRLHISRVVAAGHEDYQKQLYQSMVERKAS